MRITLPLVRIAHTFGGAESHTGLLVTHRSDAVMWIDLESLVIGSIVGERANEVTITFRGTGTVDVPADSRYSFAMRVSRVYVALSADNGNRTIAGASLGLSRQAIGSTIRAAGWLATMFPAEPGNPRYSRRK